ncbi:MAG: hypothetical protein ACTSU2_01020 [Promethearchaeota archaeon]
MKAYLLESIVGYFICDEKLNLIEFETYPLEHQKILNEIRLLNTGEPPELLIKLMTKIKTEKISVQSPKIASIITKIIKDNQKEINVITEPMSDVFKNLRRDLSSLIKKAGVDMTSEQLNAISLFVAKNIAREKIRESGEEPDVHIRKMIETIDDTIKNINIYSARLREWYGIHFPELTDNLINDNILFANIINEIGKRDQFDLDNLVNNYKIPREYAEEIIFRAENSMGAEISDNQLGYIKSLAQLIIELVNFRDQMIKNLEKELKEYAPNLLILLGTKLAAELINLAGGLKKLAIMPSSTIQVLGAEKALFRSLRKNTDSPKHGIIYKWPQLRNAKAWQRGKISRLLAGKISICAKLDYFKGEIIADRLTKELNKKIETIKTIFSNPPKKKSTPKVKSTGKYKGGSPKLDRIDRTHRYTDDHLKFSRKRKEIAKKKSKQLSKSKYKQGVKRKK